MGTNSGCVVLAEVTPRVVKPLHRLEGGHCAVVRCALWQKQRLVTAGEDARICAWTPQGAVAAASYSAATRNPAATTHRRATPYHKR